MSITGAARRRAPEGRGRARRRAHRPVRVDGDPGRAAPPRRDRRGPARLGRPVQLPARLARQPGLGLHARPAWSPGGMGNAHPSISPYELYPTGVRRARARGRQRPPVRRAVRGARRPGARRRSALRHQPGARRQPGRAARRAGRRLATGRPPSGPPRSPTRACPPASSTTSRARSRSRRRSDWSRSSRCPTPRTGDTVRAHPQPDRAVGDAGELSQRAAAARLLVPASARPPARPAAASRSPPRSSDPRASPCSPSGRRAGRRRRRGTW